MADKELQQIIRDVKKAKLLHLMVDETPEPAHQKQVPFVLHNVDSECTVQEGFTSVHEVMQTDNQSLEQAVRNVFFEHSLELDNICGRGYNGAASMSGQYTCLQSKIKAENDRAIYIHCYAHILNLVLVILCSRNCNTETFLEQLQLSMIFFCFSSKRHAIFMKV